jgi:hydrogenase expression/formation protein HypC
VPGEVDIRLTPDVGPGDWLLVFLGAARRTITPDEAAAIADALAALDAAGQGETLDPFFADLTAREPQLPEHMETARRKGAANV